MYKRYLRASANTIALLAFSIMPFNSVQAVHSVPGTVFQDQLGSNLYGPEMVVIPAGRFIMGSPEGEPGRFADEGPQHEVNLTKAFALGRKEVSVAEFAQFVTATDYLTDAETSGGSWIRHPDVTVNNWLLVEDINWRHDHLGNPAAANFPVVHVDWHDAQAYAEWLSITTGQRYRLPSEAEFEYANRAGSRSAYWWGNGSPVQPVANIRGVKEELIMARQHWSITGIERKHATDDGPTWYAFPNYSDGFGGLAPVGSLQTNRFNLYDTTGNVWEWTEDCYQDSYKNTPTDGQSVNMKNCERRVLRGASFYCLPRFVRSANRWAKPAETRGMYIGFRVAREL